MKPTARTTQRKRTRKPNRGRIVYGPSWGRWIMRNVERDLRSGALRVNAEGATLH
jgi:hypothetical protein